MNHAEQMWDFPVKDGVSFKLANRVHPLMQAGVEKVLQEISRDRNVRRLVLFGSALEFRCNSYSDLDLYIEKENSGQKLEHLPELDCEIDIITNLSPDSRLYQEIERTGLLLFER